MKYIKIFENVALDDLKYLANSYGSYLIDNGCEISANTFSNYYKVDLRFKFDKCEYIKSELPYFMDSLTTEYQFAGRKCIMIDYGNKNVYITKEDIVDYTFTKPINYYDDSYSYINLSIFVAPK